LGFADSFESLSIDFQREISWKGTGREGMCGKGLVEFFRAESGLSTKFVSLVESKIS
jgi:hypothetical protein